MNDNNVIPEANFNDIVFRLRQIKNTKDLDNVIYEILRDASQVGKMIRFECRLKSEASAIQKNLKYERYYHKELKETKDALGVKIVTETEEDVLEFLNFFKTEYGITDDQIIDYIANPKDGYKSIHINYVIDLNGTRVPIEIQIKTLKMAVLQDTMHDSIYKSHMVPFEEKSELSKLLFPIFENLYNMYYAEKTEEAVHRKSDDGETSEVQCDDSLSKEFNLMARNIFGKNHVLLEKNRDVMEFAFELFAVSVFKNNINGKNTYSDDEIKKVYNFLLGFKSPIIFTQKRELFDTATENVLRLFFNMTPDVFETLRDLQDKMSKRSERIGLYNNGRDERKKE